jgi:putative addiction module killer protein
MHGRNQMKTVVTYKTESGKVPFNIWFDSLRDRKTRQRILSRLFRVENGHYGDYKSVGEGVFELRFFFSAGYRVYFGEDGNKIVVLLTGGDKSSQNKDIQQAKAYWKEYLNHAHSSNIR